uniref:Small cysteine and glycine repeat containing 1 n=1 Tax=Moschus moschiferus TaxID=68415 RepID=A0A8C6D1P9_MOSMO
MVCCGCGSCDDGCGGCGRSCGGGCGSCTTCRCYQVSCCTSCCPCCHGCCGGCCCCVPVVCCHRRTCRCISCGSGGKGSCQKGCH